MEFALILIAFLITIIVVAVYITAIKNELDIKLLTMQELLNRYNDTISKQAYDLMALKISTENIPGKLKEMEQCIKDYEEIRAIIDTLTDDFKNRHLSSKQR